MKRKRIITGIVVSTLYLSMISFPENTKAEIKFADEYTFTLEGDTYTLPCQLQEFLSNNWISFDETVEETLQGGETGYIHLLKNEHFITVAVVNFSAENKMVGDCYVATVGAAGDTDIKTADGISLEMPIDKIKEAMGTEYLVTEEDTELTYVYGETAELVKNGAISLETIGSNFKECTFDDEGKLHLLVLGNYTVPEEFEEDIETLKKASGEPEVIESEETELGTDLLSGKIEIEGEVYQFPISVKDMEKNGWKFEHDGDIAAGAYNERVKAFYEGSDMGEFSVDNNSGQDASVSECDINNFYSFMSLCEFAIPGDIKPGSTWQELVDVCPEIGNISESNNTIYDEQSGITIYYEDDCLLLSREDSMMHITLFIDKNDEQTEVVKDMTISWEGGGF